MKPSDDPWAAPASSGQGDPQAAPPTTAVGHIVEEHDPWASTSASDRTGPGGHGPASTAGTATCYLLHFDRPYVSANGRGVAGHYSGSTADLQARLAEHDRGQGARLLQVVKAAGITWRLARTWPGGRDRERQLKNQGGASRRCPECGVTPRRDPAGQQDTAAARKPPDRDTGQGQPGRSPERAGPSWARAQIAAQIQRLGIAPAAASRPAEAQPREPDHPQLPDLEAEP